MVSEILIRCVVFIRRIGPGDYESGLRMGAPYSYTPENHYIKTFEKTLYVTSFNKHQKITI